MTLHILPGPSVERRREIELQVRWCFKCRARHAGYWVLLDYEPESPYWGNFDPMWVYRCNGCGEDHRFFPGTDQWA